MSQRPWTRPVEKVACPAGITKGKGPCCHVDHMQGLSSLSLPADAVLTSETSFQTPREDATSMNHHVGVMDMPMIDRAGASASQSTALISAPEVNALTGILSINQVIDAGRLCVSVTVRSHAVTPFGHACNSPSCATPRRTFTCKELQPRKSPLAGLPNDTASNLSSPLTTTRSSGPTSTWTHS